jgi:hypothetical protein
MQAEAPADGMYVPAGHDKQFASDAEVAPVCPYFPSEHSVPEQVSTAVAPSVVENLPASQLMQAEAPADGMYVPAGHDKQFASDADVAPVCPYFPAEHIVPSHAVFGAPLTLHVPANPLRVVVYWIFEVDLKLRKRKPVAGVNV